VQRFDYRFRMYEHLGKVSGDILAEVQKAADELRTTVIDRSQDEMEASIPFGKMRFPQNVSVQNLIGEMREIVKDVYGDAYDACPASSVDAAMWMVCRTVLDPSRRTSGRELRASYLMPWEKWTSKLSSFGCVHPPRYEGLLWDESRWAGLSPQRIENLDAVVVPLQGAVYANHGIAYTRIPFLTEVIPESSIEVMAVTAEAHIRSLVGFFSQGYDTPGLAGGIRDESGIPALQLGLGQLASEFDVPYVVDSGHSLPLLSTGGILPDSSITVYRLGPDLGSQSPAIIIGQEDLVTPLLKQAGLHRTPPLLSYAARGAPFASCVPVPGILWSQVQLLRLLKERAQRFSEPVNDLSSIVFTALDQCPARIKEELRVTASYGMMAVELNYEDTWRHGIGLPVFTEQDTRSGTNLLQLGLDLMGAKGVWVHDASVYLSAAWGDLQDPSLDQDEATYAARCVALLLDILSRHSGFCTG
jgi:hypothetical protein